MVKQIFSEAFRKLAKSLGIDIDKMYEDRYLSARRRLLTKSNVYLKYHTGRLGNKGEDPRKVLEFYNDLSTRPSESFIAGAREFFVELTRRADDESMKVKKIAAWINSTAVYTRDADRWGKPEYWSSPFDLWAEYLDTGRFTDDCDGWAVLMYWACTLVGVPKERVWVWAGNAEYKGKPYGHSNLLYDNPQEGKLFHIEGSFLNRDNQRDWLGYPKGCPRYYETWFLFNEDRIRT